LQVNVWRGHLTVDFSVREKNALTVAITVLGT